MTGWVVCMAGEWLDGMTAKIPRNDAPEEIEVRYDPSAMGISVTSGSTGNALMSWGERLLNMHSKPRLASAATIISGWLCFSEG
jgi:hypothetical protein